MKLLAYLKLEIKGLIRQFPAIIFSYVLFPIVFVLLISYVQKEDFQPEVNQPIFSIEILDEDNTDSSRALKSYFESKEISKILNVKNSGNDDIDYTVKIPKGYSKGLIGESDLKFIVEASKNASTSMGNLLVNLIDNFNTEVSKSMVIDENITNSNIDINEINSNILTTYLTDSVETIIYKSDKSLTSYEYISISYLSFVFILFIMAIISSDDILKEIGVYNRIMSTGLTKVQYFNLNFISNYLTMIVINTLYIFFFRFTGLSFSGSLGILFLIILLQSLIITLIGSLIMTILPKSHGYMISLLYLGFYMVFGGMMGTPMYFRNSRIFEFLSKFKADILISDTYRNYLVYNNLSSIYNYLLAILGISIMVYIINIIVVKKEWSFK